VKSPSFRLACLMLEYLLLLAVASSVSCVITGIRVHTSGLGTSRRQPGQPGYAWKKPCHPICAPNVSTTRQLSLCPCGLQAAALGMASSFFLRWFTKLDSESRCVSVWLSHAHGLPA
jgi:hypothetical protein